MKKFLLVFTFLLLLTGCWDYKELNEYSIVTGIAIDKTDDKYEVSVLISNSPKDSSNSESNKSDVVVYSGKADTIFGAFKDVGLISPKEIYFGSFSVLIISDDVAKEGIEDIVDVFLRYPNSRKSFYVTIAKDSKAKDILKIMTPLSNFPSQNISNNLSSSTNLQGIITKTNFNELLSILVKDGIDPTINSIYIVGDKKDGFDKDNLEKSEPKSYVKLGNLALFKEYKLVDYATYNESLGINFINNNIKETHLRIKYNNDYVVIDTTKIKSTVIPSFKDNKPKIDIDIKGEATIIECSGNIDLNDYKTIEELQKLTDKKIKKLINEAITKAKNNKTDIFGFGLLFYQEYPKYFSDNKNDWDNIFESLNTDKSVKIILKNKVSSKNSLEEINDKEKD